jgi:integrase
MSPWLRDELLSYRASLSAVTAHTPVFPTRTGNRRTKDNVRARVTAPAARRANERREAAGLSALPPGVTPHTLRHTFISFLLEAAASPRYVMAQVGHPDPKTTLRIYAHLLKRDRTGVGKALDELTTEAFRRTQRASRPAKTRALAGVYWMGAAGFEPATSRV